MKFTQHSPAASLVAISFLLIGLYLLTCAIWATPYFVLDTDYEIPKILYKLHELYIREEAFHPDQQNALFLLWIYLPALILIVASRLITKRIERLELLLDDNEEDDDEASTKKAGKAHIALRITFYVLLVITLIMIVELVFYGKINDYGLLSFIRK